MPSLRKSEPFDLNRLGGGVVLDVIEDIQSCRSTEGMSWTFDLNILRNEELERVVSCAAAVKYFLC